MSDRFELPSELTIYNVLDVRDKLLTWVTEQVKRPQHSCLQVSARAVNEVDSAGLQLLAALGSTGQVWQLLGASAAFEDACHTMGLAHWLHTENLDNNSARVSL